MNQLQADRMMTWAHFMETRVEPEELNMNMFVQGYENECATVACAAGWLPEIFLDWKWAQDHIRSPVLKVNSSSQPFTDMENFFGLSWSRLRSIAHAESYENDPAPKQVAERIRKVAEKYDWVPA